MANVLVTGAAGFLGRHVMERLVKSTVINEVFPLDNREPTCGFDPDYPAVRIDVTNYDKLYDWMCGCEITHVAHLAAIGRNLNCQAFPMRAWEVNAMGTVNVLEAAHHAGVKRVVCCSSNIVLCPDMTTYKASKQAAEAAVLAYQRYGLSCQALRPSNIAGSGQSKTEYQLCSFAALDETYKKKGYVEITGDGTQSRDYIDARDVARAFELALFSDYVGPTIDIATGHLISLTEVANRMGLPVQYVDPRPGDAQTIVSDTQEAYSNLGFVPLIPREQTLIDSFPSTRRSE